MSDEPILQAVIPVEPRDEPRDDIHFTLNGFRTLCSLPINESRLVRPIEELARRHICVACATIASARDK